AYSIHMMIVTCVITIAITDWVTFSSQRETIQAYRDPLTGLPSYNFLTNGFDNLYQQKIAGSNKDAWIYIVTLSSVDRMTRIFGVEAARSIREQYISRLRESFGNSPNIIEISISQSESSKLVSIPGGNIGFLVSGSESNHEIQAILSRIEEPFEIFGVRTSVTITAGYAKLYDGETGSCADIREAYQKANQALAEAVASAKPVKEYEETPKSAQSSTLLMASRLSTAIERNELQIHIQPQYCEQRKLAGGEVLMRWNDIELGQVPPSTFIVLAEEAGMIFGITRLAIEKSFKWLSQNKQSLPEGFRLSINLSVEDLHNSGLFSVISQCLRTYGHIAYMITFEITETACSSTLETLREGIKKLKKFGFRVAIDDFGTGYSSIAYLKDISPNTVKIDRTFIQGIDQSDIQQQFVRSIVDMAAAVKANIVSEGIENEMELRTVLELGSDYYQGFYSGRPVPAENFIDTYARHCQVPTETMETATFA
ncbi:MAG: GGDEF domain-containing phosphodiesterase, partial [Pseudomonadota bacterium]|nr:GGDEF domain-containing phosphodiesterase [Pseudomonadota bacterium]